MDWLVLIRFSSDDLRKRSSGRLSVSNEVVNSGYPTHALQQLRSCLRVGRKVLVNDLQK